MNGEKTGKEVLSNLDVVFVQIGNLLSTSHELIQKIFRTLGYHDLLTAVQVCHTWSSVGHAILQKERKLRFTTIHPNNLPTTDLKMETSAFYCKRRTQIRINSNNGIYEVGGAVYEELPNNDNSDESDSDENEDEIAQFEKNVVLNYVPSPFDALENFLERLPAKPFYCLGFTCGVWISRNDIVTKYSPNESSLSNLLKNVLPKECEIALICASGVIGSVDRSSLVEKPFIDSQVVSKKIKTLILPNDLQKDDMEEGFSTCGDLNSSDDIDERKLVSFNDVGYSIELEEAAYRAGPSFDMDAMSLLLLPKQPGVQIKIFNLDEKEFYKTYRPNTTEQQKRIEITEKEFNCVCGLTSEDELKAFLIFTHSLRNFTRSFLDAAQSRQNDNVALGGGLIELLRQKEDSFRGTIGVAISGRNVGAASIVVPSSVRDELALKLYLQKLKESRLPEGHSLCFMFSCCGRGSHWYGRNKVVSSNEYCNVETRAFRKLFPNTPIFGFFGDGEIGNNYDTSYRDEKNDCCRGSARKRRKRKQNLFHQYSSVFVFVSFL